jgi:hypothetical protein
VAVAEKVTEKVVQIPPPITTPPTPNLPPVTQSPLEDEEEEAEVSTTDIGLQTDLEGDPDVFYFAGGRHVGSQPDYDNEEYGPLEPFLMGQTPIVIVMSTSDSDVALDGDVVAETTQTLIETPNPNPKRPATPAETKSSGTQLSVGGLAVAEKLEVELEVAAVEETEVKIVAKVNENETKPAPAARPTTFAEKAKRGMLRPCQSTATAVPVKPFLAGGTRPKVTTGAAGTTASGPMPAVPTLSSRGSRTSVINYRSNIASRCRTAVNKGLQVNHQQQGSQVHI